jgi:hypothetical protein
LLLSSVSRGRRWRLIVLQQCYSLFQINMAGSTLSDALSKNQTIECPFVNFHEIRTTKFDENFNLLKCEGLLISGFKGWAIFHSLFGCLSCPCILASILGQRTGQRSSIMSLFRHLMVALWSLHPLCRCLLCSLDYPSLQITYNYSNKPCCQVSIEMFFHNDIQ